MPTLTFQPEADRYYAEGYWRDGDLWTDFARRAEGEPGQAGADPRRSHLHLRSAPACRCRRLGPARGGRRRAGRHRHPPRPSFDRGGGGDARLHAPRRGHRAAAADVQRDAAVGVDRADAGQRVARVRRREGARQVPAVADQVPLFLPIEPDLVDRLAQDDPPDEHVPRHADDLAMVLHSSGTTSTPKGIAHSNNTLRYATEGICKRWELTGEDIYLVVCEFGFVGGLVFGYFPPLFNGATGVLVNRWRAEDALRLIEEHRCTYVLSMPTHSADLIEAKSESGPRVAVDARACGSRSHAGAPHRDAGGVRRAAARRLRPVRGPRARRAWAPRARREDRPHRGPSLRRHGDPDRRRQRASGAGEHGRLGDRQRPEPLSRLSGQRRADAASH